MKFCVTVKDPDSFIDALEEAVKESVAELELDHDERFAVVEERFEKAQEKMKKWVQYSEYITVEFDLTAMTAVVVPL